MAQKITYSFKALLLLVLIPLFILTFVGIRNYSHEQYAHAILTTADNFTQLSNLTAISQVNEFLKPGTVIKTMAEILNAAPLKLNDAQLLKNLQSLLTTNPDLANIYIADNQGNFIKIIPLNNTQTLDFIPKLNSNAALVIEYLDAKKNQTTWSYYDSNAQLLQVIHENPLTDPRNNPWYQGAISNQDYWINTYDSFNDLTGLTLSYPIIDQGKVLGVIGVDFNATAINTLLTQLQQNLNSTLFIINDQGTAFSTTANFSQPNSLITAALADQTLHPNYPHIFNVNNANYIVGIMNFKTDYHTQWRIGTIVPLQTIMGQVNHTDQIILAFAVAMLALTILLLLFATQRLTQPLKQLTQDALKLQQLEFAQSPLPSSHLKEINTLSNALNASKETLELIGEYIPYTLIKKLMSTDTMARISGQKQQLTLMFTKISTFSHLERLKPKALAEHFSDYLNTLTQIILETQGQANTYMNDTLMAFWGAPIEDDQQIKHTCLSTLLCRHEMHKLNADWQAQGKPCYDTRFALHTGNVFVGNIASADQMHYTALGENVNFAMNLTTINKTYGLDILASLALYQAAQEDFLFRPIDFASIPGRRHPVLIYELVAALTPTAPAFIQATSAQIKLCELTRHAFNAFQQKNWPEALKLYKEIQEQFPEDRLANIFIKRC
jgi:adenylate cyclase